jgi:molybdopterin synthase catalytic subunit
MGIHITITHDPIERPPDDDDLASKNIGAVAEFLGIVRDSEDGKPIAALEYESFREMAEHQLHILAEKYSSQYGLSDLLCTHRIGKIPAGETSLFIRITSSHRAEAFTAMSEFINDLKKIVPIWKHPVYT